MKAADRIEDFRKAIEVALSADSAFSVTMEDHKTFLWIYTRHNITDGRLGAAAQVTVDRPDLRKPIPYVLVEEAALMITEEFGVQSKLHVYTKEARAEAWSAYWQLTAND